MCTAVSEEAFRRWHDGGAPNADFGGRPSVELPPFAFSRQSQHHLLAARPPPCAARAQHRIRAHQTVDAAVSNSLQLSWKFAAPCTRHRPSEADTARERNLLQLRVIYLCDRFGISQDRIWNLDETAVRMVPSGERGWTKRAESTHLFA